MKHKITEMLAIGIVILSASFAQAGDKIGGGGNPTGLEFTQLAKGVLFSLKANPQMLPAVDRARFESVIQTTEVLVVNHTLNVNGIVRVAVNYPEDLKIEINEGAWKNTDPVRKATLAFHEYLGIMGNEKNKYVDSGEIMDWIADFFDWIRAYEMCVPTQVEEKSGFYIGPISFGHTYKALLKPYAICSKMIATDNPNFATPAAACLMKGVDENGSDSTLYHLKGRIFSVQPGSSRKLVDDINRPFSITARSDEGALEEDERYGFETSSLVQFQTKDCFDQFCQEQRKSTLIYNKEANVLHGIIRDIMKPLFGSNRVDKQEWDMVCHPME